jgi:hypothetical protein
LYLDLLPAHGDPFEWRGPNRNAHVESWLTSCMGRSGAAQRRPTTESKVAPTGFGVGERWRVAAACAVW